MTNDDRFMFIMFVIWCKIHKKDHLDLKLDQKEILMGLEGEDFDKLHDYATFAIVESGKCPICWEPWEFTDSFMDCPHCGVTAIIDEKNHSARVEAKNNE